MPASHVLGWCVLGFRMDETASIKLRGLWIQDDLGQTVKPRGLILGTKHTISEWTSETEPQESERQTRRCQKHVLYVILTPMQCAAACSFRIARLQTTACDENVWERRFHSPRGLRRWSVAARLLGLWVRIPPGAWMSVSCQCCVLSSSGLCVELIYYSSRGVLPSVVCRSVIVKLRKWESPGPLGGGGPVGQGEKFFFLGFGTPGVPGAF